MSKIQQGQTVNVHYVGTLDDGTEFDNSRTRGETITFQVGAGNVIKGFDNALVGMTLGETKKVRLSPTEAYGETREDMFKEVSKSEFPSDVNMTVGGIVKGETDTGQVFMARIDEIRDEDVTLNFNHPMAGKHLNFEIELVSLSEDSSGE